MTTRRRRLDPSHARRARGRRWLSAAILMVAAVCAFALVAAGLWLQQCCKSPGEPQDRGDTAPDS